MLSFLLTVITATGMKCTRLDLSRLVGPLRCTNDPFLTENHKIRLYKDLPKVADTGKAPILEKLAVLKLNGGLGTTMGCVGPKRYMHASSF